MADLTLQRAFRFYLRHAGYVVGERAACALRLAKAARYANDARWRFEWVYDDEPYELSDAETEMPEAVMGCVLRNRAGDVLGSLWGIGDPSDEYRCVVQAELASEALYAEQALVEQAVRTIENEARNDREAQSYMAL